MFYFKIFDFFKKNQTGCWVGLGIGLDLANSIFWNQELQGRFSILGWKLAHSRTNPPYRFIVCIAFCMDSISRAHISSKINSLWHKKMLNSTLLSSCKIQLKSLTWWKAWLDPLLLLMECWRETVMVASWWPQDSRRSSTFEDIEVDVKVAVHRLNQVNTDYSIGILN